MKRSKIWAILGASVLALATFGVVLAATGPSDQGVTPTEVSGNIQLPDAGGDGNKADCAGDDAILTGNSGGSDTSANGVTVTWTYDADTKEFGFTATGGLVTIAYVKGSNSYNEYDYTGFPGGGVASDGGMFAPENESGGPAGLSHAIFCTGPGEEETPPPSFEQSQEGETDEPSDEPSVPADTDEPSFEQSQQGETDAPTEPNTAALGTNGTSAPADGAWLLVVALGVLLASIVVLSPARAKGTR